MEILLKTNNKNIILIILFAVILGIVWFVYEKPMSGNSDDSFLEAGEVAYAGGTHREFSESSPSPAMASFSKNKEMIYIHVVGAVKRPDVYIFDHKPRIVDVIKKAGGFKKNAAKNTINMAESLDDGMQLVIPTKSEVNKLEKQRKADSGNESLAEGIKVDLNKATRDELMTLSGVGESKADAIIEYRESTGKFKKIEDLMNIPGIKEGVFNKIKEKISIG